MRHFCIVAICAAAPLLVAGSTPDNGLVIRARYSFESSDDGGYSGQNPAQQLSLGFDSRDVRISSPEGSVRFHLTGYGYGDRLIKPAPGALSASGDRLEYQRGDLTEWYVNGSQGLEQGFTVARRPAISGAKGQPLIIAIAVASLLKPVASDNAVDFASSDGVVFRYRGLRVWDARGRHLTSRLEVQGRELRLIIDDRHAEYPVTIDPTRTQQ